MYSVYNYFYKYYFISSHQRLQIVTAIYQPSEESRWKDSEDEDEDDKDDEENDKKPLQDKPQTQLKW